MPWSRSNSYDTVPTNQGNPNPNPHRTLKRAESRVDKFKRQMSQGAGAFLGLSDPADGPDSATNIWLQRRAAFHGGSLLMGRNISKKCREQLEQDDSHAPTPTPRDPLHRPESGFRWPSPVDTKPRVHFVIDQPQVSRSISEQPGTAYRQTGGAYDETDNFHRQMSQSSAVTRSSIGTRRRTLHKKDSVARIALDGISQVLGFKSPGKPRSHLYSAQSRSLPPPSVGDIPDGDYLDIHNRAAEPILEEEDSLDDEVFFDNKSHGTSALDLRATPHMEIGAAGAMATTLPLIIPTHMPDIDTRPMAGWRAGVAKPLAKPGTPGVNLGLDEPDFRFPTRIIDDVTNVVLKKGQEKRRLGEGIIGRLFHRELKDHNAEGNLKDQLDNFDDHRPYFTYWVTFVQIVVFIVSVSVFGIAPIGVGKKVEKQDVLVTALYPQTIGFTEPENFWIGPRQMDLIHLGAKYAPCMRKDPNIDDLHEKIRRREADSVCCIYTDNSGCYQSSRADCNALRANWDVGKVCGQDPSWCVSPKGNEWSTTDITQWPVCKKNHNGTFTPGIDDHMSCNILSRPCCIGVKGECQMLTEEHCQAKKGYFHENATLCSQVKCLGKVCGLINFLDEDHPDQFYRLWLSLFLHAGVFHLLLTIVFQALIMRDMEKLAGGMRVAIIYLGAGLGGNLASAIFLPYHVELPLLALFGFIWRLSALPEQSKVGPAGSQFGILSTLWVEVIQSWQLIESPGKSLGKVGGFTAFLFILGLLPWIDNYAHMFGFVFGILLSFALIPYVTFGSEDRKRKLIIKVTCIVLVVVLYVVLFIVFYVTPIRECKGCRYINCVPFKDDFCENMGVEVEATETKFEWEIENQ